MHIMMVFFILLTRKIEKKTWYEYGNSFVNVLLSLDDSNEQNGTIEIAKSHKNNFDELIKNTKNNGTPDLLSVVEKNNIFEKIKLNAGDLVVFKNTCPHRSGKNASNSNRRILYYTYLSQDFGSQYENYFKDKKMSKNKSSKSLSGEK